MLDDIVTMTRQLRPEAEPRQGLTRVLLRPTLAMSFVRRFVASNLNAAAVLAGRSAYTLEDFRVGRKVARSDLSLVIDTLLDLELAASPVSSEGVPGGRAELVSAGNLARPVANLKQSGLSGFPPTPVPGGPPSCLLRSSRKLIARQELIESLDDVLEVSSVLGLHGQDPRSGRYNTVAPAGLVMNGGRPLGRAKVSITGNFFEHLLDERLELVNYGWGLNPGLLIWTTVSSAGSAMTPASLGSPDQPSLA